MEKYKEKIIELLEHQLRVMQDLAVTIHEVGNLHPEVVQDFVIAQGYDDIGSLYLNIDNLKLMIAKLKSMWR